MPGRALLSVYDKSGICEFAGFLQNSGFTLMSTGGTFRELHSAGLEVEEVSAYTGAEEIMEGRVKTLHPRIYGGILGRRGNKGDVQTMERLNMEPVDVVAVNLYPFFEKSAEKLSSAEILEFIDIGGPSMLRAAAKNYADVMAVTDPSDYQILMDEWKETGCWAMETRRKMAAKVFALTSAYDSAVAEYLSSGGPLEEDAPEWLHCSYRRVSPLRYGENPHQKAAWYVPGSRRCFGALSDLIQHQGKELSYNNLRDLDAAWKTVCEFGFYDGPAYSAEFRLCAAGAAGSAEAPQAALPKSAAAQSAAAQSAAAQSAAAQSAAAQSAAAQSAAAQSAVAQSAAAQAAAAQPASSQSAPPQSAPAQAAPAQAAAAASSEKTACVGLKHAAPCAAALADTPLEAWQLALEGDPVSIFGGIAAFNREVDAPAAEALAGIFLEVIAAPGYTEEALAVLSRKKNLRVVSLKRPPVSTWEALPVDGGITLQQTDREFVLPSEWTVPTRLKPDESLMETLVFAWKLVKHVKSNGIVLARSNASVGIGNGQPNRVGAVRLALQAAGGKAEGSVLASDAFFPFADWVEEAAAAGVKAVIQPGGSIRDEDSVSACDKAGLAMVFTGRRHFRH